MKEHITPDRKCIFYGMINFTMIRRDNIFSIS